jgi:hypothetical protein
VEILEHAIGKQIGLCSKGDQMAVAAILTNANWTRRKVTKYGKRTWFYCRPNVAGHDTADAAAHDAADADEAEAIKAEGNESFLF